MFAHQVIDDIKDRGWIKYFPPPPDEERKKDFEGWVRNARTLVPIIQSSQKFHGGDAIEIHNLFKGRETGNIFNGEMVEFLKLPYPVCWVDFLWGEKSRLGILAIETMGKKDLISVYFCVRRAGDKSFFVIPVSAIVSIGQRFQEREDLDEIHEMISHAIGKKLESNVAMLSLGLRQGDIHPGAINDVWWYLLTLERFLMILHCKNVETEFVNPPPALNKKRRLSGHQEIFTYRLLNIIPFSKKGYAEATVPLSHNRVHLCRGHFKKYTAEHPLFGKHVGLWWWQPAVKGQNKEGIVIKDYNLTK